MKTENRKRISKYLERICRPAKRRRAWSRGGWRGGWRRCRTFFAPKRRKCRRTQWTCWRSTTTRPPPFGYLKYIKYFKCFKVILLFFKIHQIWQKLEISFFNHLTLKWKISKLLHCIYMKQLKLKFNLIGMKNSKISRIVEASKCVYFGTEGNWKY